MLRRLKEDEKNFSMARDCVPRSGISRSSFAKQNVPDKLNSARHADVLRLVCDTAALRGRVRGGGGVRHPCLTWRAASLPPGKSAGRREVSEFLRRLECPCGFLRRAGSPALRQAEISRALRENAVGRGAKSFCRVPAPLAAGKWESSVEERRSPLANAKVRQEIAVFRRKTLFSAGKRRSPLENVVLRWKTPNSAGKRRFPLENVVLRWKTSNSAGKRHLLAENAVFWQENGDGRPFNAV